MCLLWNKGQDAPSPRTQPVAILKLTQGPKTTCTGHPAMKDTFSRRKPSSWLSQIRKIIHTTFCKGWVRLLSGQEVSPGTPNGGVLVADSIDDVKLSISM